MMIGAPQAAMSPIRAAGMPPMSTVGLPGGTMADGGCTAGGGNEQMCGVPTVAAGIPAISTVGTPGGPITPGCPVGSPTLAIGGIASPRPPLAIDLHQAGGDRAHAAAVDRRLRVALQRGGHALQAQVRRALHRHRAR